MKFGQVEHPETIDFTLPPDAPITAATLKKGKKPLEIYVGCAKWNKKDLKNFYPKKVKDELVYYSSEFNCIELNATFYNMPTASQAEIWKGKTPDNFKFFPKITNSISHFRRLKEVNPLIQQYCDAVSHLEEKLGMVFLQLHDNFKPKDFDRLVKVVEEFPKAIPLAIEVRNQEWYSDPKALKDFQELLAAHNMANILVDTAGRRDMMHMALTSTKAFVRYVGANHASDYTRLEAWVERIKIWKKQGLEQLYFFVHQNVELESPLLAAHFVAQLNKSLGMEMHVPKTLPLVVKKVEKVEKVEKKTTKK